MTHTKAPWAVFYKHKYDEWHVSLPGPRPGSMRLGLFPDGAPGYTKEECEGNARLIAASPQLLDLHKRLLSITAEWQVYELASLPNGGEFMQLIVEVKTAVDKAGVGKGE